ncbi:GTP-binding protein [Candidatus Woesearchaeota archaeon]|nr:GTP-binding protein [Candidatus Woesearchaeota archaeon]
MKTKKQIEKKVKSKKVKDTHTSKKLPVTIITGYLGSGKTTLVNHILQNNKGLKVAVIVNEFGEIGIDNQLIVSTKEDIIELSNGCICCQVRGDIIEMILKILRTHQNLGYLMIETSGLANPVPVAQTFFLKELQQLTEMDSIITVADAAHFEENLKKSNGVDQIKAGDIILLNKADAVTDAKLFEIKQKINSIAPHARIIETKHSKVNLGLILNIGQFDVKRFLDEKGEWIEEDHGHDEFGNHIDKDGIISFMFKADKMLDIRKFQAFAQKLPDSIFRSKGIIYFKGLEDKAVYQQVGRRIDVKTDLIPQTKIYNPKTKMHVEAKQDKNIKTNLANNKKSESGKKQTQIVFIGQKFDFKKIEDELKKCIAE